jgi:hypothetical protein
MDVEVVAVAAVVEDVGITVMAVVVLVEAAVIPMQRPLVVVAIITTILMKQFPNHTQPAPFMIVVQPNVSFKLLQSPISGSLSTVAHWLTWLLMRNSFMILPQSRTPSTFIAMPALSPLTEMVSWLGDYPERVWFNPHGIANILSLDNVSQHYRVTMDTSKSNSIALHRNNGSLIHFTPCSKGLYRYAFDRMKLSLSSGP